VEAEGQLGIIGYLRQPLFAEVVDLEIVKGLLATLIPY